MLQVRKVSAIAGALAAVVAFGLVLLGGPGTAAQRGGGSPPPPQTFETLCVSVHNGLVRAISSGRCQSHEVTVDASGEDLPLTLCVNEITKVARSVGDPDDCAAPETVIDVTGLEDFAICVSKFTAVVRVPAPATCQASEITGVLAGIVGADSYESLSNVGLDVSVENGLRANDAFPFEIRSSDATSQQGGEVALNPDGSFTYAPPAGFVGEDSFNYIFEDGGSGVEFSVEISVDGPVIWFVNNDTTSDGDGRLNAPFRRIAAVNDDGADPDQPGDVIYLFDGIDNYGGGLALEAGQKLIGQCLDLVETANITVPPFSAALPEVPTPGTGCTPVLENVAGSGNALDLAPDTFIGGLRLAFGDHGIAGADFAGDVELRTMIVSGMAANAVNLVNIDGTVSFDLVNMGAPDGEPGADGKVGLYAENVTLVDYSRGIISAGNGGADGGDGGLGISLTASNIELSEAFINGGSGGSSDIGSGGDAGSAMFIADGGNATIVDTRFIGGIGAQSTAGSGGQGGNGVLAVDAGSLSISGSELIGKPGGPTSSGISGDGGRGLRVVDSERVVVTTTTLEGGNGASPLGDTALGGAGGDGLSARSTPVSVQDSVLQGAPALGNDREDGAGFSAAQTVSGPYFVDIQNNVLLGGDEAPGLEVNAFGADVCLNALGNSNGNGGSPDEFQLRPEAQASTPTLSVTQSSAGDISGDNNGATIKLFGLIGFGCTGG